MAYLTDGFPTIINLASGAISLKEKHVTPPSMEAGGPNDTTTMRNTRWRTRQPKKLITLDKAEVTAAYDPVVYSELVSIIGENQIVEVIFSDGSNLAFWGWLDGVKPGEIKEGEQPVLTATFVCSNQDNSNNEQAPVYSAA